MKKDYPLIVMRPASLEQIHGSFPRARKRDMEERLLQMDNPCKYINGIPNYYMTVCVVQELKAAFGNMNKPNEKELFRIMEQRSMLSKSLEHRLLSPEERIKQGRIKGGRKARRRGEKEERRDTSKYPLLSTPYGDPCDFSLTADATVFYKNVRSTDSVLFVVASPGLLYKASAEQGYRREPFYHMIGSSSISLLRAYHFFLGLDKLAVAVFRDYSFECTYDNIKSLLQLNLVNCNSGIADDEVKRSLGTAFDSIQKQRMDCAVYSSQDYKSIRWVHAVLSQYARLRKEKTERLMNDIPGQGA
jgi:hypothetical protein